MLDPKITDLCQAGDRLLDSQDLLGALIAYQEALSLVPEPKHDYAASVWLYTAIGDALLFMNRHEEAHVAFHKALFSATGFGNPYIHMRLGQCRFEMNDLDLAADELMRAYMGDAEAVIEGQDPKYFEFLKTRAHI
ncbi:tetratricopeptide repeat protein [Algisphaera agarilytica]|uniref:Tetratricopeptide (TPR) repeat protein n=1 Tax=Algisphaera agarilytica TaxID=1385975 RepID=A0A7X0HBQ9_9BACT|nr:tetratricopeptide repeat protein [Algisphaera agarilytica]MBB6431499.1 tetratricopeptide (TPR) repeat protein [Algisphaera agarilytica]